MCTVRGNATAGDQHVDMRMIFQLTSPGMQHRKNAGQPAKVTLRQRGDQAATILVAADVGQPLLAWLADFFFVNNGQS